MDLRFPRRLVALAFVVAVSTLGCSQGPTSPTAALGVGGVSLSQESPSSPARQRGSEESAWVGDMTIFDPECRSESAPNGSTMLANVTARLRQTFVGQAPFNVRGTITLQITSAPVCPDAVGYVDSIDVELVAEPRGRDIRTQIGSLTGDVYGTDIPRPSQLGSLDFGQFVSGEIRLQFHFPDGAVVPHLKMNYVP